MSSDTRVPEMSFALSTLGWIIKGRAAQTKAGQSGEKKDIHGKKRRAKTGAAPPYLVAAAHHIARGPDDVFTMTAGAAPPPPHTHTHTLLRQPTT